MTGRRFLSRIELLAADLNLGWLKDRGPAGVIQYQKDVADLQRKIQSAISEVKADRRPAKEKAKRSLSSPTSCSVHATSGMHSRGLC